MNRTSIEWTRGPNGEQGYTWNPVTGCTFGCEYCYARENARRFKTDFAPTFHPDRVNQPCHVKKPSTIFTVSMGDLFDPHVSHLARLSVFNTMFVASWHRFVILTKQPQKMRMFCESQEEDPMGRHPWPLPNVWLGVTVTGPDDVWRLNDLMQAPAAHRFICAEPLLEVFDIPTAYLTHEPRIEWLIIGGQTGHVVKWVDVSDIMQLRAQCFRRDVPVFVKDNTHWPCAKEFPW